MIRRTFKLAWFKRNRYALTVIAIALSVAFIVSTLLLTTSIADVGEPLNEAYDGVDVAITGARGSSGRRPGRGDHRPRPPDRRGRPPGRRLRRRRLLVALRAGPRLRRKPRWPGPGVGQRSRAMAGRLGTQRVRNHRGDGAIRPRRGGDRRLHRRLGRARTRDHGPVRDRRRPPGSRAGRHRHVRRRRQRPLHLHPAARLR